jgi:hypothetical protein
LGIQKPWKRRLIESRRFLRAFSPSFGIVASNGTAAMPTWWPRNGEASVSADAIYVKHDLASVRYRDSAGRMRAREVALSDGAAEKLRAQTQLASRIRRQGGGIEIFSDWNLMEVGGYACVDRTMARGTLLSEFGAQWPQRIDQVCEGLRRIHALGSAMKEFALTLPELLRDYAGGDEDVPDDCAIALQRIGTMLSQAHDQRPHLMHGDCTPRNILISADRVEFIDWEWSRVVRFPGFDILNLLWRDQMSPDDSQCFWSRQVLSERVADFRARDRFHLVHPNADWESSVLTFWAVRMARGICTARVRGSLSLWIDDVMRPSLEAAQKFLLSK